jgi:hypothetical protein
MGPSANLEVKAGSHEKQKSQRNCLQKKQNLKIKIKIEIKIKIKIKIVYEKSKIFSTAFILLRGVAGGLVGLQMTLGAVVGLVGSWVAMGGRRWPLGLQLTSGGHG